MNVPDLLKLDLADSRARYRVFCENSELETRNPKRPPVYSVDPT
jgi:hypothetical protein